MFVTPPRLHRREFLTASTVGLLSASASVAPLVASAEPTSKGRAKSTILFFLCGGASHIDTWDMKPDAPLAYRGPFQSIATTAPDIRLCEHLPMMAKQAEHIAIVRSVTDYGRATGDHHAGYYYNLTGRPPDITFRTQGNDRRPQPDDWPFLGSIIGSQQPPHPSLPQIISLPHKPSKAPYTRPGQFAGRLGFQHDPFYLKNDPENPLQFLAPSLSIADGMTASRLEGRKSLLAQLDSVRRRVDNDPGYLRLEYQQQKAFELLTSGTTADAFRLEDESEKTRERYGETINGLSLLMARRLVEAGVPFVTVFWKEHEGLKAKCKSAGGWDTHGNNFNCLQHNLLPEFDRAYSALIEDLSDRGLLDETLVMVTSEMGRRPKIGDPRSGGVAGAGRDHWTKSMSVLLAGGGIRGGQVYGSTDKFGEEPKDNPVGPEDIAQTVYAARGIESVQIRDTQGRPFNLLDEGHALDQLFG
ncbi:MAG: DUF1501 domain-containing protein [Pirellulaceae bacterium]